MIRLLRVFLSMVRVDLFLFLEVFLEASFSESSFSPFGALPLLANFFLLLFFFFLLLRLASSSLSSLSSLSYSLTLSSLSSLSSTLRLLFRLSPLGDIPSCSWRFLLFLAFSCISSSCDSECPSSQCRS